MSTSTGEQSFRPAVQLIFLTFMFLMALSAALWLVPDPKAKGAAIALAGGAATHLMKETQQILAWMRETSAATRLEKPSTPEKPESGETSRPAPPVA